MNTAKKWSVRVAFVLAITIAFLFLLFPSEAVKKYVNYRITESVPDVGLEIGRLALGIPPGLTFRDVDVDYLDQPAVRFDRITVVPAYLTLMSDRATVRFSGMAAGGGIRGRTTLDKSAGGVLTEAELCFDDILLDDIPAVQTMFPLSVAGKASGEIIYDTEAKGTANLMLKECQVKLKQAVMGIGELKFTQVDAEAELENNRLVIKKLDLKGSEFSGTGSGTINLMQPLGSSRISISATIKPHPSLMQSVGALIPKRYLKEGGIPVKITGTVSRPNVALR